MSVNTSDEKIWQVASMIPKGKVATYGQVAELAGLPRAARLVGHALRKLPKDSSIPWHRVVNAQGRISLPASSPSFARQKKRLLDEGVLFVEGKIYLPEYQWKPG